jgi:hypothetical protein
MKEHNLTSFDLDLVEIESIELIGEEETVDITVEDTHMFFANDIYTHNSALEDDVIEAGKISESYSKVMIADFVLSLSRKVTDKIAGTGRFHIIKNRFGPDGITFPSKMNMSNGQIHIYEETSVQGKDTNKQMQTGEELLRKSLLQKYKEVSNDLG